MHIRYVLALLFLAFGSSSANAWFFIFIPGSVTSAIGDAISGSEGDNCVTSGAKVGDRIKLASGSLMQVKSLSGTSTRCQNQEFPIRALLEPLDNPQQPSATTFNSKAGIELPEGWDSITLTDQQKANGIILSVRNPTIGAGMVMSAAKRQGITNMQEFAKTKRISMMSGLTEAHQTEIEQLEVNGMPAWRFEAAGKVKTGHDFSYLYTLIDGGTEIIVVNAFIPTAGFAERKAYLSNLVYGINGLNSQTPSIAKESPVAPTAPVVTAAQAPHQPQDSVATRLGNLNKLLQDGLITQDDFDSKKKEIIQGL